MKGRATGLLSPSFFCRSRVVTVVLVAFFAATAPARAQLRPLEPVSWEIFGRGTNITAEARVARYENQRASLAGTEGTLWEVPTVFLAWRSGRVAILASGTGQRFFVERERFAPAYFGVRPSGDGKRHDSGEYTIATAIRLTTMRSPIDGLVRFGTRLPATDNKTGLDRDAIDFFATVAARGRSGPLTFAAETGVSINSTRDSVFEQDDLLVYALRLEYETRAVTTSVAVLGQAHGPAHQEIRGVEDLSEMRVGLRLGHRRWVRIEVIKGLETFSPDFGVSVAVGLLR